MPRADKISTQRARAKGPGLDTRHRDVDGEIRRRNGNTTVGALRRMYGEDFASSYRSDAKVSTLLERTGAKSVEELINREIFSRTEATYRVALKRLAKK